MFDLAQKVEQMQAGFDTAIDSAVKRISAAAGTATTTYVDASINGLEGKLDAAVAGSVRCRPSLTLRPGLPCSMHSNQPPDSRLLPSEHCS